MVNRSDYPKTVRYRGKQYRYINETFDTKTQADRYVRDHQRIKTRGINFYTVVKKYIDSKKKCFYVVYWRGVYSKARIAIARKNKPSNYK